MDTAVLIRPFVSGTADALSRLPLNGEVGERSAVMAENGTEPLAGSASILYLNTIPWLMASSSGEVASSRGDQLVE